MPGDNFENKTLTAVKGIRVGHAQNEQALTGCTVVLCEAGAVGGVDVRGGAPGTRETDALRPTRLVSQVHGVLLAGGSAFGLDAAGGVMRYLEEQGSGFDTGLARIPIVPAAILYDLAIGQADVRPDAAMGYAACQNATSAPVIQGCVGAGTGASVGKIFGMASATKTGVGSSCLRLGDGLIVAALVAVNVFGDIVAPDSSAILAGPRTGADPASPFASTLQTLAGIPRKSNLEFPQGQNTLIGVVATNARLSKEEANTTASMAHDGIARAVRPAHTLLDGDTIFALATGEIHADVNTVGAFAAEAIVIAIVNAVQQARSSGGLPSAGDLGLHF